MEDNEKFRSMSKRTVVFSILAIVFLSVLIPVFLFASVGMTILGLLTIMIGIGVIFVLAGAYSYGIAGSLISMVKNSFRVAKVFNKAIKDPSEENIQELFKFEKMKKKEFFDIAIGVFFSAFVFRFAITEVFSDSGSSDALSVVMLIFWVSGILFFALSQISKKKTIEYLNSEKIMRMWNKYMNKRMIKALSLSLMVAIIMSVTGCSNGYKNSILSSVALYVDEDCTLVDKTRSRDSLTYLYKLDNRDNLYFSVSCSKRESNSFGGNYVTNNSYENKIRSLYTEDINNCIESFDLNITDVQSYYSLPGYYVDCYDDEDLNQVLDAIDAASEIFSVEQEYHEKECTIIAARFQINYYVNDEHMLKFNIRIYCEVDREQLLADIHEIIDYCVTEDYWDSMKLYILN